MRLQKKEPSVAFERALPENLERMEDNIYDVSERNANYVENRIKQIRKLYLNASTQSTCRLETLQGSLNVMPI